MTASTHQHGAMQHLTSNVRSILEVSPSDSSDRAMKILCVRVHPKTCSPTTKTMAMREALLRMETTLSTTPDINHLLRTLPMVDVTTPNAIRMPRHSTAHVALPVHCRNTYDRQTSLTIKNSSDRTKNSVIRHRGIIMRNHMTRDIMRTAAAKDNNPDHLIHLLVLDHP